MKCNQNVTNLNYLDIWCNETRTQINEEMTVAIKNRKKSHTQQEIAEMLELSRRKINQFENGQFDFNIYDQYKSLFYETDIRTNKNDQLVFR